MTKTSFRRTQDRRTRGWSWVLAGGVAGGLFFAWRVFHVEPGVVAGDIALNTSKERARVSERSPASEVPTHRVLSMDEELKELRNESDPTRQEQRLRDYVASVSLAEIPAMLSRFAGSTDRLETDLASRWMRRWAEEASSAACAFAVSLAPGRFRSRLLEQAALGWTEADWSAASDWAQGFKEDPDKNQVLRVVAEEVIRKSPVESLLLAFQMDAGGARTEVVRHAAMEWASVDVAAAEAWSRRVADESLRGELLSAIAVAWADRDAPAAAGIALQELPPGRLQEDTVLGILNRWAQTDSRAASAWVDSFPPGLLKQTARSSVFGIWSASQPEKARAWFDKEADTGMPRT